MADRTSHWNVELGRFLKPFLDQLGHKHVDRCVRSTFQD